MSHISSIHINNHHITYASAHNEIVPRLSRGTMAQDHLLVIKFDLENEIQRNIHDSLLTFNGNSVTISIDSCFPVTGYIYDIDNQSSGVIKLRLI